MDKRMLSIIVIVTTLISSGVMFFESSEIPLNENINRISYNKNTEINQKDNNDSITKNLKGNFKNEDKPTVNETDNDSNNDIKLNDAGRNNDESGSAPQEVETVDDTNTVDNYGLGDEETTVNALDIFKIPMEKIEKNLSLLDKAKLISLRAKISSNDYTKINNYLKDDDQIEGIVKTISLLKTKLSRRDYNRLRKIAIKYIDMDKVENLMASRN